MRQKKLKLDGVILLVALLSTTMNYIQSRTVCYGWLEFPLYDFGISPWRVAFLGITLCLLLYAVQNARWSNKWTIVNLLLFGVNFLGVVMGFNIQTKGYAETIIILGLVWLSYYLFDKRKQVDKLLKSGGYKRKGT